MLTFAGMNSNNVSPWEIGKQAAAYFGLAIGVLWILSFGLAIAGLRYPVLSTLGLLVGLFSIFRCGHLVGAFRANVPGVGLSLAFRMCWLTMLFAALLTTMAQYIYFRWLDGGMLATAYRAILEENPVMAQAFGAENSEFLTQAIEMIESLTPAQWAMNMLFYNALLATVLSPLALVFAKPRRAAGNKEPQE